MNCTVKVGFFSLRKCGGRPVGTCETCRKPMCLKHRVTDDEGVQCSECAAKSVLDMDESWGPDTIYARRRDYHRSRHYEPHGYGSSRHYYDSHDSRSFDEAAVGAAAGAVAGGAMAESLDDDGSLFDS